MHNKFPHTRCQDIEFPWWPSRARAAYAAISAIPFGICIPICLTAFDTLWKLCARSVHLTRLYYMLFFLYEQWHSCKCGSEISAARWPVWLLLTAEGWALWHYGRRVQSNDQIRAALKCSFSVRQQVRTGDIQSERIIVALHSVSRERGGFCCWLMSPDQCSTHTRKVLDLKWERAVCKKLVIALVWQDYRRWWRENEKEAPRADAVAAVARRSSRSPFCNFLNTSLFDCRCQINYPFHFICERARSAAGKSPLAAVLSNCCQIRLMDSSRAAFRDFDRSRSF